MLVRVLWLFSGCLRLIVIESDASLISRFDTFWHMNLFNYKYNFIIPISLHPASHVLYFVFNLNRGRTTNPDNETTSFAFSKTSPHSFMYPYNSQVYSPLLSNHSVTDSGSLGFLVKYWLMAGVTSTLRP